MDVVSDDLLALTGVSAEELAKCISVLDRLNAARGDIDISKAKPLRDFRKALVPHAPLVCENLPRLHNLGETKQDQRETRRKYVEDQRREKQRLLDEVRQQRDAGGLFASRLTHLKALEGAQPATAALADGVTEEIGESPSLLFPDGPARPTDVMAGQDDELLRQPEYVLPQMCYMCKVEFTHRHHFYSEFCPRCASLNWERRGQRWDLQGRVCLVTGARLKIGYMCTLKLLRMGARVIATTRFPADARQRYAAEPDAADWADRLMVYGLDFRFVAAVQAFCQELCRKETHLDVLINNACQTVRRPAGYYKHLLTTEYQAALEAGDTSHAKALADTGAVEAPDDALARTQPSLAEGAGSAAASQLSVLAEDNMVPEQEAEVLPAGQYDQHGRQVDTRKVNSWSLKLGQIETGEAVEVFAINSVAPFVLNGELRPLMERSPFPDRYVVNVSAMEGKFNRWKLATHPHTNMAKAALNMMTRTCAQDLARHGIYMNCVDTGWVNDEHPLPTAVKRAAEGFQAPIDEIDAAARILDPVLKGMRLLVEGDAEAARAELEEDSNLGGGGIHGPHWGRFLKNYIPTGW